MCEIVEEVSSIVPYVYLGSQRGLTRAGLLDEFSIKTVITVVSEAEWKALRDRLCATVCESTHYDKHDDANEDMLTLFPAVCERIARAVTEKSPIFVHCMQGVSRSATLMAAYLMASRQWAAKKALQFLKSRRANIDPNENFRNQLALWERLQWRLDMNNANLRNYLVDKVAMCPRDWPEQLSSHLGQYLKLVKRFEAESGKSCSMDYFCKKCNTIVCHKRNILCADNVDHVEAAEPVKACEHHFIEPLYWMKKKMFQVDKETGIGCPGCSTRLGTCRLEHNAFKLCACAEHDNLPAMKIRLAIERTKLTVDVGRCRSK